MSVTAAVIVLLWLVVLYLLVATAALWQQVKLLQAAGPNISSQPHEDSPTVSAEIVPLPAGILLVTPGCNSCKAAVERLDSVATEMYEANFLVLTRSADYVMPAESSIHLLLDAELFNSLDPGWQPALVSVGADGAVVSTEPVGSNDALDFAVSNLPPSIRGGIAHK